MSDDSAGPLWSGDVSGFGGVDRARLGPDERGAGR